MQSQTDLIETVPNEDIDSRVGAALASLRALRANPVSSEYEIHDAIKRIFQADGIPFQHEVKLSEGCRIDFVVDAIGIEVKRGKPRSQAVMQQLMRYAAHPDIAALVLVVERNIWALPRTVLGKPVHFLSLNANWGVAI